MSAAKTSHFVISLGWNPNACWLQLVHNNPTHHSTVATNAPGHYRTSHVEQYSNFRNSFRTRTGSNDSPETQFPGRARLGSNASTESSTSGSRRDSSAGHTSNTTIPSFKSATFLGKSRTISRAAAQKCEPMGLNIVYDPPVDQRAVDIIFVHGLGGTSRLSWCWDRDLSLFWPQEWLPLEPGLTDARVLTFGYNAHFMSQQKDIFNISDFAKDLLLRLKTGYDENLKSLHIGDVPIIFVVHSMGGLVVKKAYILGSQDPQYQDILKTVCGIVFLATPHFGSSLAEILNRFLHVSFQSAKQYVNDLGKDSARIGDINDQFKFYADRMDIVSFFETQSTSLGVRKAIVVEKDSAVLNYPNEISSPLNANHHTVNKFPSRSDENYRTVRNVVRMLVDKFRRKDKDSHSRSGDQESTGSLPGIEDIMNRIGIVPRPTDSTEILAEKYVWGSCDWVLAHQQFCSFVEDDKQQPSILHITAPPGSGKSVLAAFLVQHFENMDQSVQYWFFKYNDQLKKSIRQGLLSLAFQIAEQHSEYSNRLVSLGEDMDSIARSDLRSLWTKLFITTLDRLAGKSPPLYWVVDAVDECESAQTFLNLLASLRGSRVPLRIIFLTRAQTVTRHFDRLRSSLPSSMVAQIAMTTPQESLALYISDQLQFTSWPGDLKDMVTATLLERSQGSFLWLSLVLRDLANCDTVEELEAILDETPRQLLDIYERMEKTLSRDFKSSDESLVRAILSWITCTERQLEDEELKDALKPTYSVLNLKHTITRLCGDFVVMDKKGKISMVHHTAKEYLTRSSQTLLGVDQESAHSLIFQKCLTILEDPRFRIRLKSQGCVGLTRYCCLSWPYHLARAGGRGDILRQTAGLAAFFRSTACLAWIEAVSAAGQLQLLVQASKTLISYTEQVRALYADLSPLVQPMAALETLGLWSTELVRIVGRFGFHLSRKPSCVYSLIPLFCPPESAIRQQFFVFGPNAARVSGIANTTWDDSLAKFTVGQRPRAIFALDSAFGVLTADRCVNLYSAFTFEETMKFDHSENVFAAQFSLDGSLLATCGPRTIKVWDTTSSRPLYTYNYPGRIRAMAVAFSIDASELIICCVDSSLKRQLLSEPEDWLPVRYQSPVEGQARGGGTPICVTFSPDGSKIVIAYRTALPAVWDTEHGNLIGRIENRHGRTVTRHDNVGYPVRMVWNPVTEHVLGIFNNGDIFKWYPLDPEHIEIDNSVHSTEIACSPDGNLVVVAQRDGSLKIFKFESFTLLYNLTSNLRASAIALSPDGRRIYDIRGAFCNVWEPNALIRMAEVDDKLSDTASSHFDGSIAASSASEAAVIILDPITAVATSSIGQGAFAFGNDSGRVRYWRTEQAEPIEFTCGTMSVSAVELSRNVGFIAAASIDRKIVVMSLQDGGPPDMHFEVGTEYPVNQLLFVGNHLLIRARSFVAIRSLESRLLYPVDITPETSCCLVEHPFEPHALLAVGLKTVKSFRIKDNHAHPVCEWSLDIPETASAPIDTNGVANANQEWTMNKASLAPNGGQILVQLSRGSTESRRRESQHVMLDTEFLKRSENSATTINAWSLPKAVQDLVELPLGFVVDEIGLQRGHHSSTAVHQAFSPEHKSQKCSLVFVDKDFWVRTWSLDDSSGTNSVTHFFLPRDWINLECLDLAQATPDGRVLCPRNGELAVVHHGMKGLSSIDAF